MLQKQLSFSQLFMVIPITVKLTGIVEGGKVALSFTKVMN